MLMSLFAGNIWGPLIRTYLRTCTVTDCSLDGTVDFLLGLFGWSRLGLTWLITVYFLSHNTIQSNSRALFILPAEQALLQVAFWSFCSYTS